MGGVCQVKSNEKPQITQDKRVQTMDNKNVPPQLLSDRRMQMQGRYNDTFTPQAYATDNMRSEVGRPDGAVAQNRRLMNNNNTSVTDTRRKVHWKPLSTEIENTQRHQDYAFGGNPIERQPVPRPKRNVKNCQQELMREREMQQRKIQDLSRQMDMHYKARLRNDEKAYMEQIGHLESRIEALTNIQGPYSHGGQPMTYSQPSFATLTPGPCVGGCGPRLIQ